MNSLREYAFEAWAQEQERRKQSDRKKRKRKAKKIEEDIDDLLPRDVEGLTFVRDLEDPRWDAVISVTDIDETVLRFTFDDEGDLSLLGKCPTCNQETTSLAIDSAADLGQMLDNFTPSHSHQCKSEKK